MANNAIVRPSQSHEISACMKQSLHEQTRLYVNVTPIRFCCQANFMMRSIAHLSHMSSIVRVLSSQQYVLWDEVKGVQHVGHKQT